MPRIAQWEYTNDRLATEAAYAAMSCGGAERCGCATCRNYVAIRERLLPESFVSFLLEVGIDPSKDGEVYHVAQVRPGIHQYGGWYHFVGELEKTGDFLMIEAAPGFRFFLTRAHSPHLKELDGSSLVEVGFVAEVVPWVLTDAEPK